MTDHPKLGELGLERLQAELARLRLDSIRQRLALLETQVPEIVADAKRFLVLEQVPPWETVLLFPEGELGNLLDKYDFGFLRRRPDAEQVAPATDLFFEAIELLYELQRDEHDADAPPMAGGDPRAR